MGGWLATVSEVDLCLISCSNQLGRKGSKWQLGGKGNKWLISLLEVLLWGPPYLIGYCCNVGPPIISLDNAIWGPFWRWWVPLITWGNRASLAFRLTELGEPPIEFRWASDDLISSSSSSSSGKIISSNIPVILTAWYFINRKSEFILAARYCLGLPVFQQEGECPMPRCRSNNDQYWDHAIFCAIGSERIARHNHLRNAIHEAAAQAALAPQKEPPGFIPGSDERPAEICSLYNMYK